MKDFFTPQSSPSSQGTVSSSEPLFPGSYPVLAPNLHPIALPADSVQQSISVLSRHVLEISIALQLSPTGALDHFLRALGGTSCPAVLVSFLCHPHPRLLQMPFTN